MDSPGVSHLHLAWLALVAANFAVQLLCFYKDETRGLRLSKKITTPTASKAIVTSIICSSSV